LTAQNFRLKNIFTMKVNIRFFALILIFFLAWGLKGGTVYCFSPETGLKVETPFAGCSCPSVCHKSQEEVSPRSQVPHPPPPVTIPVSTTSLREKPEKMSLSPNTLVFDSFSLHRFHPLNQVKLLF